MIDMSYYQQEMCECGDPDCLGSTHVAAAMVQTLPVLRAPMQRLLNERDEARRMCEVLAAALPGPSARHDLAQGDGRGEQ
jgi:hypothetical protein